MPQKSLSSSKNCKTFWTHIVTVKTTNNAVFMVAIDKTLKKRHCLTAFILFKQASVQMEHYTVEPQWLEHLWDHGNSFETRVVRATEG